MKIPEVSGLLLQFLQGSLSAEEMEALERWKALSDENRRLFEAVTERFPGQQFAEYYTYRGRVEEYVMAALKQDGEAKAPAGAPVILLPEKKSVWLKALVAASVILVFSIAAYWWLSKPASESRISAQHAPVDINPASQGALLTLADGSQVLLDSLGNGLVATQNGTDISLNNGSLTYLSPAKLAASSAGFNILQVPKGRQFAIVLPDGTKVFINAASSLKYPVAFTGKERTVAVSGEAYFEVAKNARHPFRVMVNDQMEVEVLGTIFNVNSYSDESHITTTLLDGAVRVLQGSESVLLHPGEQALAQKGIRIVKDADLQKAVAWKNGLFNFEKVGLREMMRQLERWYDIEVVYEGDVPDTRFFGEMSRMLNLATVLDALKGFGLRYRMEGRTLVVMP